MSRTSKHLVILGTARSGTSWLCEIIARQSRYRLLYEPEHEFQTKDGHLIADKWIEETGESKKADAYIEKILSNSIDNDWIAQHSNRNLKRHLWPFLPKKLIIKCVRCNLIGKYLNEDYGLSVVHLIRNPYDVIFSQMRSKFPWLLNLDSFVEQKELANLIESNYNFRIETYQNLSDIQILCLRWCIENVIPIEMIAPYKGKFEIIKYEDLKNDVERFLRLCENFNLKPVDNLREIYSNPSSKTHFKSAIKTKTVIETKWSDDDLRQINTILEVFRTNLYSIVKP